MILLDTSGVLAAIDASQRTHAAVARALVAAEPPLILSPFVLAELDCLLATRAGPAARSALLAEVAWNAYRLESFSAADVAEAGERLYELVQRAEGAGLTVRGVELSTPTSTPVSLPSLAPVRGGGGA